MDLLRSCYSTQMQLDRLGGVYGVDWYFTAPGTPFIGFPCFASLNWVEPEYGRITLGEQPNAARPYRTGARPIYVPSGPTWPLTGRPLDFSGGAAAPLAGSSLTWDGRRPTAANPAGTFPRFPGGAPAPVLTDPGFLVGPATFDGQAWHWDVGPDKSLYWAPPSQFPELSPLWICFPLLFTLEVQSPRTVGGYQALKCTSYNSGTGLSTWTDPTGRGLAAGETLTLASV